MYKIANIASKSGFIYFCSVTLQKNILLKGKPKLSLQLSKFCAKMRVIFTPDRVLFLCSLQRLTIPTTCPESFATLMRDCWQLDPYERPTFKQIINYLNQLDNNGKDFVIDEKVCLQSNLGMQQNFGPHKLLFFACRRIIRSDKFIFRQQSGMEVRTASFCRKTIQM